MCKSTSPVLTVDIPRSSSSMFHTPSVSMRWWDWESVTSSRGRGRRYFTASCRQPHIYDQSWQGGTITHHYPTWTQVIWSINCRYAISIFSNCYHLGIWSTWWRFVTIADHYKPTCVLLIELTQLNLSVLLHYKYNIYWYLFLNHIIHLSIILGLLYEHFWSVFLLNRL